MKQARILVFGQSNSACFAETAYTAQSPVFAQYLETLEPYADPVIGADYGENYQGSIWGFLGDMLVTSGRFDEVVFSVIGVGSTLASHWDRTNPDRIFYGRHGYLGADLSQRLEEVLAYAVEQDQPWDYIIWQQGETDGLYGTSSETYAETLSHIIEHVRTYSDAPMFITLSTQCFNGVNHEVRLGQWLAAFMARDNKVYQGIDMDHWSPADARYRQGDMCHLADQGQKNAASAWFWVLMNHSHNGD
jgi:hypothetical protein